MSSVEHVETILEGLPMEYDSLVTTIASSKDPHTVSEVESLLLADESKLGHNRLLLSTENASTHVAHASTSSVPFDLHNDTSNGGQFTGSGFCGGCGGRFSRGNSHDGFGYRRGVECQLCRKIRHEAFICYHRFDAQFVVPPPMAPTGSNPGGFPQQNMPQFTPRPSQYSGNLSHRPPPGFGPLQHQYFA